MNGDMHENRGYSGLTGAEIEKVRRHYRHAVESHPYFCDKAAAVEECYDAIAVLLRMVDVLEGRQTLGDPAKAKEVENAEVR